MPDPRWRPAPNVTYTKLDEEEAVLLHLETKQYFSLNETGLRIWEGLEEPELGLPAIAASLSEDYDIAEAEARDYVERFAETLAQEGLLQGPAGA